MANQYEILRDKLMGELVEIEQNSNIIEALDKTLPNSSDETNYDDWLEMSAKFAKDNEELLKALVK